MADGLSRGDAARSSKLRLLNIMQNGTRVGLSCVCVCAGIHCHLAGYTATHHAVHCLRIPSLNLEILYNFDLVYHLVEGGWDTQSCSLCCSDRGVAAVAVAMSIEHRDFHW